MRQAQLGTVLGYLHRAASPDSGGPDDAQLLDRWRKQRDPAAFEVLVWRHGTMVWNVCHTLLGREQDAEDAFQATFLAFLRKADTIGQGRFLGSWLYKVSYRIALAARAASARHTFHRVLAGDVSEAATVAEDGWDDLGPVLHEEVNRLPEKYRRAVILCYLEGKTTGEAARDLGCPRGTVGTRLAWARERLRSRLTRRGVALSAAGLAALLAEKAAAASVPAALVLSTVKAAAFSAAGKALAAGVISARAVALTQGVLQAMFVTKLKSIALVLFVAGILGSGAGLLAHQTFADTAEQAQSTEEKQPAAQAEDAVPSSENTPQRVEEDGLVLPEEDKGSAAKDKSPAAKDKGSTVKDKGGKEIDWPQISGKVVRVDKDGKSLGLEVATKGEARTVELKIADKTQLVFSSVGPNEASLKEGYSADVWLEKDSKDVAARVRLSGKRSATGSVLNEKSAPPQRTGRVAGVAADGKGISLEKPSKGERPLEQIAILFTEKTRVFFSNVPRDGAKPAVGYEGRVWLEDNSQDTAKAVSFVGTAEGKPPEKGKPQGKGKPADRSGKLVGLSRNGKVLTVEVPAAEKGELTKTEIKLTEATKESYHGVTADGAKPVEGYLVQVWLAEGSQDTAARLRFVRNDPRKSVDARIMAVSEDGGGFTVAIAPKESGEATKREIKITEKTRLVFFNVGPGGAKLAEGYHVRGWLVEGSEDTADELILSRLEKTAPKKPDDKKPGDKKPEEKKEK